MNVYFKYAIIFVNYSGILNTKRLFVLAQCWRRLDLSS